MALEILIEKPPAEVWVHAEKFYELKAKPKSVLFPWGVDLIYNPGDVDLRKLPHRIAHADMLGQRQGTGGRIVFWWLDYLSSATFRLEEEIAGHRAEYRQLLRTYDSGRKSRRVFLKEVASRMRDPMYKYNHLFSMEQAVEWIKLGPDEYRD